MPERSKEWSSQKSEIVAGFEPEDADGFYADVLIGGGFDDGGIGIVGDGAGEDVGGAAAGMGDVD